MWPLQLFETPEFAGCLRKLVETDHFYKKKPSAEYGLLIDMPNRSLLMLSSIGHVSALGFIATPWISDDIWISGGPRVCTGGKVANLKYFLGNIIQNRSVFFLTKRTWDSAFQPKRGCFVWKKWIHFLFVNEIPLKITKIGMRSVLKNPIKHPLKMRIGMIFYSKKWMDKSEVWCYWLCPLVLPFARWGWCCWWYVGRLQDGAAGMGETVELFIALHGRFLGRFFQLSECVFFLMFTFLVFLFDGNVLFVSFC